MPRFLLDTDVLSVFAKRGKPHPAVVTWLDGVDDADLAVCVMTITEIVAGVARKRRENAAIGDEMAVRVGRLLRAYRTAFLPIGADAAELLGEMHACPPLRTFITGGTGSKPQTGADLIIAACAIANGLVVVTRNTPHFALIHDQFPLPGLFNPFDGKWVVRTPPAATASH